MALKPGGSFQRQKAVNKRKTSATADGNADVNRNGDTAPMMSRTQTFNDPPFVLFQSAERKSASNLKT